MIESNERLSFSRPCQLLNLVRSTYYYELQPADDTQLALVREMDEQYLKTPQ
ncbi:MAG: hypothetical protein LZF61_06375 [Nitrosomonas sp.]|nr:MAG: hypothetical protein LZF61_06375 [Nitrosomonas sp.]